MQIREELIIKSLLDLEEEKSLIRKPGMEDLIRKAILNREIKEYQEAINILEALEKVYDTERINFEKAITYKDKGDYKKALRELNKVKNIDDAELKEMRRFLKGMINC